MQVAYQILTPRSACPYLPGAVSQLRYLHVDELSVDEYEYWLKAGWRRFGRDLFSPRCPACTQCQSLRIVVDRFEPSRSQRRNLKLNMGVVDRTIRPPRADRDAITLHRRFHAAREQSRGWPMQSIDRETYAEAFVHNPFPSEQWEYRIDGALVGVGHVDALPAGLSAIYFAHEPALEDRGLGTWNVLQLIDEARRRGMPHVYMGYWVSDCVSLAYKARFRPYEILRADGEWGPPPES